MGILNSLKTIFKKEAGEQKAEATPAPSSEPASKEAWSIGYKIENRYEIRDIKEGGMGIVYIAYDHEWKQYFAIKTFKKEYFWNENAINRFMREAETWVNLEIHENIVWAKFVKKVEGIPRIFLEYIDGGDLSDYIGRLDIQKAIDFALQFCVGMEYAYNKSRIIHRDIKPSNALITKDGVLKITDLGLVKSLDYDIEEIESENIPGNIFLSKTGVVAGTPPYMSPEQFIDTKHVGVESDIYSFGVMFYEMLTGRLPFYAEDFEGYMYKHLNETPRDPSEINHKIPTKLDSVIMKSLNKNPADRYHSFSEIYKEITGEELKEKIKRMWSTHDRTEMRTESGDILVAEETWPIEVWINKGLSFNELGKYEDAIECSDKAIEINPEDEKAWNNKGVALVGLDRYEEAIECYDKALEINSELEEIWFNKGNALGGIGRYEEAMECLDKAININPRDSGAWHNKGNLLSTLGRYEEAMECLDKAIEINPRFEYPSYNKEKVLVDLSRYEEAIECFDKAVEINPRFEGAWNDKGIALYGLARYWAAIECFDKAIKINLKAEEAWHNKGNAFHNLERYEEAIKCYDKALEINPRNGGAWEGKGSSLNDFGIFEEAIKCFEKSIKINPRFDRAWNGKGYALANLGRYEDALECFDKAIDINPMNENARKGRELVLNLLRKR